MWVLFFFLLFNSLTVDKRGKRRKERERPGGQEEGETAIQKLVTGRDAVRVNIERRNW